MKDSAFLIFDKKGLRRMVKGHRRGFPVRRPSLSAGEYAVLVTVNVPESVFKPLPTPQATITVPQSAVVEPVVDVVVTEMLDAAANG